LKARGGMKCYSFELDCCWKCGSVQYSFLATSEHRITIISTTKHRLDLAKHCL